MRVTYFNLHKKKERFREIIEGENNYIWVCDEETKTKKHCPLQGGCFSRAKLYCFKGNLGLKEGKYQNLEINLISPCKWKVSNSHSLIQCLMVKMYFRGRNNEAGITYNTRGCENIAGRLAHISQTFSKPWTLHWQELPSYNGLTSWFCTSDIDVLLHL